MSIKDTLNSIRNQKRLGDAFNEGVEYSKKFKQLKDDVEEGREWSLNVRVIGILVSLLVGSFVGMVALFLLFVVDFFNSLWKPELITDFSQIEFVWDPILGVCLLVSSIIAGLILVKIRDGRPRGPADLILAAQRNEPPELKNGFLSASLAMVSLSGGSSVGMFGPLMHFGGCFSFFVKRRLKLATRLPLEVILGSGAAAAIAAVFSAPLGAAIFAHEAIIRRFGSFGAGPVIASAFGAYWAATLLKGDSKLFDIATSPELNLNSMFIAIGVGLASALVAITYIKSITSSGKLVGFIKIPLRWRPLVPAILLFLLSPIFPNLLGHGIWSVDLALAGQFTISFLLCLIVLKIFITGCCIGFGFFGGVFAPALFLGALVGASVDIMLASTSYAGSSFAILGAASCIAAVIGAPLAAVVIVFELTGSYDWAVLAMVSVVSSQQFTRAYAGRSLFDRQLFLRGIKLTDDHK